MQVSSICGCFRQRKTYRVRTHLQMFRTRSVTSSTQRPSNSHRSATVFCAPVWAVKSAVQWGVALVCAAACCMHAASPGLLLVGPSQTAGCGACTGCWCQFSAAGTQQDPRDTRVTSAGFADEMQMQIISLRHEPCKMPCDLFGRYSPDGWVQIRWDKCESGSSAALLLPVFIL